MISTNSTIIAFFPNAWTAEAGGFPAMDLPVAFLMNDFLFLAASFYLLKHDLIRAAPERTVARGSKTDSDYLAPPRCEGVCGRNCLSIRGCGASVAPARWRTPKDAGKISRSIREWAPGSF
jgi:hypothetical protein